MLGIRTKNIQPTRAVCRALFGPIDHNEVKKSLVSELARIESENNRSWNFNFQTEQPITGKFTWVKMTEEDDVPVAYKMANLGLTNLFLDLLTTSTAMEQTVVESNSKTESSDETEVAAPPVRQSRKRKLSKQCQITEFFPHKRKMARLEKHLH